MKKNLLITLGIYANITWVCLGHNKNISMYKWKQFFLLEAVPNNTLYKISVNKFKGSTISTMTIAILKSDYLHNCIDMHIKLLQLEYSANQIIHYQPIIIILHINTTVLIIANKFICNYYYHLFFCLKLATENW